MKKTISLLLSILMLTYSLTACSQSDPASSGATKTDALTDEEIVALAEEAYTYCFPLVLTEMTKQQVTNVAGMEHSGPSTTPIQSSTAVLSRFCVVPGSHLGKVLLTTDG